MNRLQRVTFSIARTASSKQIFRCTQQQSRAYKIYNDANVYRTLQRVPIIDKLPGTITKKSFCSTSPELSEADYEVLADETLDSLSEMFEDLQENFDCAPEYDVTFSSGVLSVCVSNAWGTIVINKQTPNKQIWLSSPISGPKRFDYTDGLWVYRHDGSMLHELLSREISEAIGQNIDFSSCTYGKR